MSTLLIEGRVFSRRSGRTPKIVNLKTGLHLGMSRGPDTHISNVPTEPIGARGGAPPEVEMSILRRIRSLFRRRPAPAPLDRWRPLWPASAVIVRDLTRHDISDRPRRRGVRWLDRGLRRHETSDD
jgi:hypothetical protein